MYPILKFQLNKKLDKEMCRHFLARSRKGGFDFAAMIFKEHPQLKPKSINEYADSFYAKHKHALIKAKRRFEKFWQKFKDDFFKETDKVFKKYPWPSGKYICFITIFPCGPRFLDTKTFQSFYQFNKQCFRYQSMHEMLHFMFYDYVEKKKSKQFKTITKDQFWHLSEIFNDIILATPQFNKIHKRGLLSYPDHKPLISKYQNFWRKRKNIDEFLDKATNEIKKDFALKYSLVDKNR